MKLEKIFLISFLSIGSLYVLFTPIGRVPDEPSHFWRAYEISNFEFFPATEDGSVGFHISSHYYNISSAKQQPNGANYYQDAIISSTSEQSEDEILFFDGGPASSYNPINYIPQVIGIFIGRVLNLPVLIVAYLARFLNLVFCGIILYFCMKFLPFLKKSLFLIAFLPMTMQEMASVSGDGSIICAGVSLIVFVLYSIYSQKDVFHTKHYAIMLLCCLMLTLTKPTYCFLCLLLLFIPEKRFGTKKKKILSIFILGAVDICLILLSTKYSLGSSMNKNSSEQISFILSNPIRYILYFFLTIFRDPMSYVAMTTGESLEWLDVSSGNFYTLIILVLFIFVCLSDRIKIKNSLRFYSLFCLVVTVGAVFTALYVIWTPVGSSQIEGVQGRYFLPFLLLIPLSLQLPEKKKTTSSTININLSSYTVMIFIFAANICSLMSILCAHI